MIDRHPVFQGGRKKKLLSVIRCDGLGRLEALREECARQKRPFGELTITLRAGLAIRPAPGGPDRKALQGTAAEIAEDLRRFKALGVNHVLMEASYRDLAHMVRTFETFARDIRPHV